MRPLRTGPRALCLATALLLTLSLGSEGVAAADASEPRLVRVAETEADTASVTILVRGMMKSRSGAT